MRHPCFVILKYRNICAICNRHYSFTTAAARSKTVEECGYSVFLNATGALYPDVEIKIHSNSIIVALFSNIIIISLLESLLFDID